MQSASNHSRGSEQRGPVVAVRGPVRASVLAADVGGTHARLGQVGDMPGRPLVAYHEYACAEHASLDEIVRDFLDHHACGLVTGGVIACPGQLAAGVVYNRNLPWPVAVASLRANLGLDDLQVINDFEAVAHAVRSTHVRSLAQLSTVSEAPAGATQVIVGPGTGLGAAVLLGHPAGASVLATEAGQTGLAPRTRLEREVVAVLAGPEDRHVSWECVLSGPGLLKLYRALCVIADAAPTCTSPEAVTAAARADTDPRAAQAVSVFCELLGSFAGDLAMSYGASGGVWLAGGVLPELRQELVQSRFMQRFVDKRSMRAFLEQVPVHLLQHGQLGVAGAASWYFERAGGVAGAAQADSCASLTA